MSNITSQLTFDEAKDLAQQLINTNYVIELKQNDDKNWIVVVIAMRATIPSPNKVFT